MNKQEESDQVWACGGGTQSAAIAALIVQGRLPRPKLAVIVDTEREKSSTWDYANAVLIPRLAEVDVTLHRVEKSRYATVDIYAHNGDLLLPVFSTQSGGKGKLSNFCSGEWKREVVLRWLRDQGVKQCQTWIGISVNEMHRMRASRVHWAENVYPLIDPRFGIRFRRSDCEAEVARMGWPTPPRSACKMCPNMGNFEWLEMKTNHPADFAYAVEFERQLRVTDPHAWLHESCQPLDLVDFTAQGSLFEDRACTSGYCFV